MEARFKPPRSSLMPFETEPRAKRSERGLQLAPGTPSTQSQLDEAWPEVISTVRVRHAPPVEERAARAQVEQAPAAPDDRAASHETQPLEDARRARLARVVSFLGLTIVLLSAFTLLRSAYY